MSELIPRPQVVRGAPGSYVVTAGALVTGPADLAAAVRRALPVLDLGYAGPAEPERTGAGTTQPANPPGSAHTAPRAAITVTPGENLAAEAYGVSVTAEGVRISAGGAAGALYAGQTLRQLLPPDAFRTAAPPGARWAIPCGEIEDAPRFSWRGAHLDVSRHFLPKREVLRLIDLLAVHKLNRLHLHLADDQGWRVESRAYPLLHEVGSHRARTTTTHHIGDEQRFDDTPHGGYYTLADLSEMGAYARDRGVTIVPEIDVPGHASAILAAYPHLGARPAAAHAVLDRWGISPAILSPLPETTAFLSAVFAEIIEALGTVPYFHIGGDECVLDDWAASAEITAHRASLGLDSPADLHAWFLRELADVLAGHGCRAVVWDEAFVSGALRLDTIVMPWRGMEVGRRAAAAGHDIVATPVFPLYFDYAEATSAEEPVAIGDAITVADVAAFEPAPASWTAREAARVLGAQFQLWTERIPDGRTLDYRAWPRGCALAQVAWSGDAAGFAEALPAHLARLDAYGVEYRPPAGPRPWQRGGTGDRRHRPGAVPVAEVMRHLSAMTHDAESTRPSIEPA
ncbi:beta-N-acetylhexosaminidase [Sphaerisporangium melleum]|uniref:beta-N-acetylhexosaminidase n=1 Tax=Sphaerisporangium melleum TaxID=321316 RepID=A0A917QZM1_9ACTN|nr:beta-N-acetylhexosaminidase [Sphaerisporangium melleum]GGK80808.1 beta-N-acetylhexosaminidase [Sphaerisporangium melleum]GII72000.1 beta-N-acetylhexosaminidase [Sphaerisporangium melleum]